MEAVAAGVAGGDGSVAGVRERQCARARGRDTVSLSSAGLDGNRPARHQRHTRLRGPVNATVTGCPAIAGLGDTLAIDAVLAALVAVPVSGPVASRRWAAAVVDEGEGSRRRPGRQRRKCQTLNAARTRSDRRRGETVLRCGAGPLTATLATLRAPCRAGHRHRLRRALRPDDLRAERHTRGRYRCQRRCRRSAKDVGRALSAFRTSRGSRSADDQQRPGRRQCRGGAKAVAEHAFRLHGLRRFSSR